MLNEKNNLTIFEYISQYILPQKDKSNETILRRILFNNCNVINWDNVKQIIEEQHPEMAGYKWNEDCMYRLPYDPATKEKV